MKQVKFYGVPLSKYRICLIIDKIKHSSAVEVYNSFPYNYWRHRLYIVVTSYAPELMVAFENLY